MKMRVGVLISGTGSNMQVLVKAGRDEGSSFEVICVASNNVDAGGIAWAKEHGLATKIINHKTYPTREAFDAELGAYLQGQQLNLIACAGFMRIMTPILISPWEGRMLNIHPSLLPKYKGLHTHQRAIEAGDTQAGCSVHWVTSELDGGPVITQTRVSIQAGDTAETLAARVLVEEHRLYPATLQRICQSLARVKT